MKKNTKGCKLDFGDYLRHEKLYFDNKLFEKYDFIDYMSKYFSMERIVAYNNFKNECSKCDCGCCDVCDGEF